MAYSFAYSFLLFFFVNGMYKRYFRTVFFACFRLLRGVNVILIIYIYSPIF